MTVDEAVAKVTGDYERDIEGLEAANPALREMAITINALDFEAFDNGSEALGRAYAGIRKRLTAAAAELLDSPADRAGAAEGVESWMRSNIGAMGPREAVLSAAWFHGPAEAERKIRTELAEMFGPGFGPRR